MTGAPVAPVIFISRDAFSFSNHLQGPEFLYRFSYTVYESSCICKSAIGNR